MDDDQSTQSLLDGGDRELYPATPLTPKSSSTSSHLVDDSILHLVLPSTRLVQRIYPGKHGRDDPLDGVAIFLLLGWGAGLLVFITYALSSRGIVFQQGVWRKYQIAAQIMATISTFTAILIVMREVYQAARRPSPQEWKYHSEFDKWSRTSPYRSCFWSLKVAVAITVALWVGIPRKYNLLQVLEPRVQSHHSNVTIQYTYLSEVDMGSRYALCCNGLFAEYTRLLLSQGEYFHSPADFYGNVKIPDLARLKGYSEDDEAWTAIRSDKSTIYSSLLGVPVSGVPRTGNTTFVTETSYYSVTCDNVTLGPPQAFWILDEGHAVTGSPIYNGPFSETNTTFGLDSTASFSVATAGFQKFRWPQRWKQLRSNKPGGFTDTSVAEPQPLLIQSTYYGSSIRYVREHQSPYWKNTVVSAYCTLQMHYVSVNITCTPSSCAGNSMRPSRMPHPNINVTDLGHIRAFYEYTRMLMIAGRDGHAAVNGDIIDGNTLTEYFLQDPYFGSNRDRWGSYGPFYRHPLSTPEEFGVRIQMVLNGFRMLHMGGTSVRDWPNLENTKFTTGDNVTEDSVVMARTWNMLAVMLLSVGLVVCAIVETVTCWRARSIDVHLG